jgi:hypothetical protein
MQVGVPGQGTGAVCNSKISELTRRYSSAPHHRPNRVAVMTDVKIAAVAGGSSALTPGRQSRLAMCASASILLEAGGKCNRKAPTELLQGAWRVLT